MKKNLFFICMVFAALVMSSCTKPEKATAEFEHICSKMVNVIETDNIGQAIEMPAQLVKFRRYYGYLKESDFTEEQRMRIQAAVIKLKEVSSSEHDAGQDRASDYVNPATVDSIVNVYETICDSAIAAIKSEKTEETSEYIEELTFDLDREYEGLRMTADDFTNAQKQRMYSAMLNVYSSMTIY